MNLKRILGVNIPVRNPSHLFSPIPLAKQIQESIDLISNDNTDLLLLSFSGKEYNRFVEYSLEKGIFLEERWESKSGEILLIKRFKEYHLLRGVHIPEQIDFHVAGKLPIKLNLKYSDVIINPKWRKNPFTFRMRRNNE